MDPAKAFFFFFFTFTNFIPMLHPIIRTTVTLEERKVTFYNMVPIEPPVAHAACARSYRTNRVRNCLFVRLFV